MRACLKHIVSHSRLAASSFLLPFLLDLGRDSISLTVVLRSILLLCFALKLYRIRESLLLALIIAVVLSGVLLPAVEHGGDYDHTDEFLQLFVRGFPKVFIVCHAVAEGAW